MLKDFKTQIEFNESCSFSTLAERWGLDTERENVFRQDDIMVCIG